MLGEGWDYGKLKNVDIIVDDITQSGVIDVAKKLPATLYNTFEDDPNELKTKKQLDVEELEGSSVEFERGAFFIEIPISFGHFVFKNNN